MRDCGHRGDTGSVSRRVAARGHLRRMALLLSAGVVVAVAFAAVAVASLSTGPTGARDWYWQNPEPQGNTLLAIETVGDTDVWAAGAPGVVLHSDNGGAVWDAQDPQTLTTLRGLDFVNSNIGWVVGDSGVVRTTTDGGATWDTQTVDGNPSDLRAVSMADSNRGWLCALDGTIRGTTNGGAAWTTQADESVRFNDIASVSTTQACAVGETGAIWTTSDGAAWSQQSTQVSDELNAVTFVTDLLGFSVGNGGTVLKTVDGGSNWTQIVSVPTSEDLMDVAFDSASDGWAVGETGTVLVTSNGGTTWSSVADAAQALYGVAALDGGETLAVGEDGQLLLSSGTGEPWMPYGATGFANLYDAAFLNALEGCAVGDGGTLLHTDDGGVTWVPADSGTSEALRGVDCVASGKGWIVGTGGAIRTSVDATTWVGQSPPEPTSETLRAVDFVDDEHGWIVGSNSTVLHTVNGGSIWETQTAPSAVETLYAVSFVDTQTGWAAGESGQIMATSNGGSSWTSQDSKTTRIIRDLYFVNSTVGYACGDEGTVLKTSNAGADWSVIDAGVASTVSLTGIHATSPGGVVVVGGEQGSRSIVRRTTDGGASWTSQATGTLNRPQAVQQVDPATAWIVGEGGMILRSTDDTAPVTTLSANPLLPDGDNDWYRSKPVITLSADEPGMTFYAWSELGPWQTYTGTVNSVIDGARTLWYYSVDPAGNLEADNSALFKVDTTAPSTPTALAASSEASNSALLTWDTVLDDASGVLSYEVRSAGSVVGTTPVNSMTLIGLTADTSYSLTVRALDVAGNTSGESVPVLVTTLGTSAKPPVAVAARSLGYQGALVRWGESTGTVDPFRYRVWRSVAGSPFSAVATVSPDAGRSYNDTTAPLFKQVRYGVSVIDARGDGAVSTPTTFTTTFSDDLPAPVGIAASSTASVVLTWSPSPLADGYHVYRSNSSTSTAATLTVQPITVATYEDTTTAAYQEYWYSVASVDDSGNVGPPSPRVYARAAAGDTSSTVEPPHGAYNANTDMCALCHATHMATSPLSLLTGTTTNDAPLCLSCHDGTSATDVLSDYTDMSRTSRHAVPFDDLSGDLNCTDCHGVHSSEQSATVPGLLRAGDAVSGNPFCYECHGEDADAGPRGDLRVFEDSAHGAGVVAPPTGTKVVCLSCHVSHTSQGASLVPYSADDRCLGCHTQGVLTGGATDISGSLAGAPDTRHDLRSADSSKTGSRLSCGNCHEPHTSTAATPCVDPDRPTTTNTISASGVRLCLRCHDDALPTSEDTSGWVAAPLGAGGATATADVSSSWETTSVHGAGDSVAPQLRSSMGEKESALICGDCHDSHGSSNRFMLHESVRSLTQSESADSLLVVPLPGGGADMRLFCDSCHDVSPQTHPAADLNEWPVDCTVCHNHAGGGL